MFPKGAVSTMDYQQLEARAREFLTSRPLVRESNAFSLESPMEKHLAVYKELVTDHSSYSRIIARK